jgi:hypothetical protein
MTCLVVVELLVLVVVVVVVVVVVLRLSWACLGLYYGIILAPLGTSAIPLGASWVCHGAILKLSWPCCLVLGCLTALSWHPSAQARSLGASWAGLGAVLRLS